MKKIYILMLLLIYSVNLRADKNGDYLILLVKSWSYETLEKHLKKSDVNVNYQDKNGFTGLMYAAQNGALDKVKLLLKKGADVNLVSPTGYTALRGAVSFGHFMVAQNLIKAGADINAREKYSMNTELINLIMSPHAGIDKKIIIARLLIKSGIDIHAKNTDGETALFRAAILESVELCRMLIDKGADVNVQTKKGQTPLMISALSANIDLVKLILSKKPKLNIQDEDENTALHYCTSWMARHKNHVEVVKLLLKAGANPNIKAKGETPLKRAMKEGFKKRIKVLNKAGAVK